MKMLMSQWFLVKILLGQKKWKKNEMKGVILDYEVVLCSMGLLLLLKMVLHAPTTESRTKCVHSSSLLSVFTNLYMKCQLI